MAELNCWNCDDNAASTVVVDSVGGDNGTLGGGDNTSAKAAAGPGGSITASLDLNGSDDYIDITGAAFNAGGDFTVSMWAALDSTTNQYLLGRAASAFRFLLINGTTLRVATSLADYDFAIPLPSTGVFFHVFAARGSGTLRVAIDGTESSTGGLAAGGTLTLDAIFRRSTSYANGKVAKVRFFDSDEWSNRATYYAEGVGGGGATFSGILGGGVGSGSYVIGA